MSTKPTADMLLLEFARQHYMALPHHNSGKNAGRYLRYKLDKLMSELTIMLNRTPIVADLTLENCDRLPDALRGEDYSAKEAAFFVSLFKAMLRYAAELELVELPDVLLPQTPIAFNHTGAADTVWHVISKVMRADCASSFACASILLAFVSTSPIKSSNSALASSGFSVMSVVPHLDTWCCHWRHR